MSYIGNNVAPVARPITFARILDSSVSIISATNLLCTVDIESGALASKYPEITYTLLGKFFENLAALMRFPQSGLSMPVINTKIYIDDQDVSSLFTNDLTLTYPENNASSASFSLALSANPFSTIPTLESQSFLREGLKIVIKTQLTFLGSIYTHTIFTGVITNFEYNGINTTVQCVDRSYNFSRPSSRISNDFYVIENRIYEETVQQILIPPLGEDHPESLIITGANDTTGAGIGNHRYVKLELTYEKVSADFTLYPVITNGSEISNINLAAEFDDAIIGEIFDVSLQKTVITVDINLTSNPSLLRSLLTQAIPTVYWKISYEISENDAIQIISGVKRKSTILEDVIKEAGITEYVLHRKDQIEDEPVYSNIIANRELPLDFINKIIIPQTWTTQFNEQGILEIDRIILKEKPDFFFDNSMIIEDSFTIKKDPTGVINEQDVFGKEIIGTPQNPSPSQTVPEFENAEVFLIASKVFSSGTSYTVPLEGPDLTSISGPDWFVPVVATFNIREFTEKDLFPDEITGIKFNIRFVSDSTGVSLTDSIAGFNNSYGKSRFGYIPHFDQNINNNLIVTAEMKNLSKSIPAFGSPGFFKCSFGHAIKEQSGDLRWGRICFNVFDKGFNNILAKNVVTPSHANWFTVTSPPDPVGSFISTLNQYGNGLYSGSVGEDQNLHVTVFRPLLVNDNGTVTVGQITGILDVYIQVK